MLETWAPKLQKTEGVQEFVSRRAEKKGEKAPKVFNVKIFEPKSETRSARLTVAEGDAALLRSPNFWPRPIYAGFGTSISSPNPLCAKRTVDLKSKGTSR